MQCPRCGLILAQGIPTSCPRCGLPFAPPSVTSGSPLAADATPTPIPRDTSSPPTGPTSLTGPIDASQPASQPAPPPSRYPTPGVSAPFGPYAPPTLPPGYAPPSGAQPYYPPPPFYGGPYQGGPYQPPAPPRTRDNKRLFIIFGALAAVVIVASLGALGLVLASNNGGNGAAHVPTVAATATPTLNEQQILKDPLTSNTYGWLVNDHCFFEADGYHVKSSDVCYAPVPAYVLDSSDIAVDVKLLSAAGQDVYGLEIRAPRRDGPSLNRLYAFVLTPAGSWAFLLCNSAVSKITCLNLVDYTLNAAIRSGVGATNTLRVVAQGAHFDFYINGAHVGQSDDETIRDGQTALVVNGDSEAVFTNILISQIN